MVEWFDDAYSNIIVQQRLKKKELNSRLWVELHKEAPP
jgi:hypothetical protein